MNLNEIDARGRACPEPVLLTKNAVELNPEGVSVLVDNICAVENISRFAKTPVLPSKNLRMGRTTGWT